MITLSLCSLAILIVALYVVFAIPKESKREAFGPWSCHGRIVWDDRCFRNAFDRCIQTGYCENGGQRVKRKCSSCPKVNCSGAERWRPGCYYNYYGDCRQSGVFEVTTSAKDGGNQCYGSPGTNMSRVNPYETGTYKITKACNACR